MSRPACYDEACPNEADATVTVTYGSGTATDTCDYSACYQHYSFLIGVLSSATEDGRPVLVRVHR